MTPIHPLTAALLDTGQAAQRADDAINQYLRRHGRALQEADNARWREMLLLVETFRKLDAKCFTALRQRGELDKVRSNDGWNWED
jgi:hypothetical protein